MTMKLITQIPVGSLINDGFGNEVELIRHHGGAPKGKALIEIRRPGGGVAMGTVADIDRFEVVREGPA